MREREGLKTVIHFANREYKEKRPKSVKVFRVKSQTVLKRGILPNLLIKQKGPIEYLVVEDRGNELKIFGFGRNGTYIIDYTRNITLRFLKTLQKSTTLEAQLPRKKIEKVEDPTTQARVKFKKIHHRLNHLLGLAKDYPYTIIIDSSLKYSNNRTFGCKITGKSIKIPSDLLTNDLFELFAINELFTSYLHSALTLTENLNDFLYRDIAFLLSNIYLYNEKVAVISELLDPPVVLQDDGYTSELTAILKEILGKINPTQHIEQIKLFLQFIQIFIKYQIYLSKIEFIYFFIYSCELFNPESDVNMEYDTAESKISYLCRNIFSDSFDFYEKTNKVLIASKDMLLSLLFGLDYNPDVSDLSEVIELLSTYSQQPIVQKEVLKLEKLVSDLLLDHVLTKQLTFAINHIIQDKLLELIVECHNNSNFVFQDFNYEIIWKPKNRIGLNETIDLKKGRDLHDMVKRSYIFTIHNKGTVQISCKLSFINPVSQKMKMKKTILLQKLIV